jgi:hypothetical protein
MVPVWRGAPCWAVTSRIDVFCSITMGTPLRSGAIRASFTGGMCIVSLSFKRRIPGCCAVGIRFLAVLSREGIGCALRQAYCLGRPYRGFHVPHRQATSGELASLRREPGTVSAGLQTPADLCSSKDVSATCVPLCVTTLQPRLHLRSTRSQLFLAWISGVAPYFLFAFTACLRPREYSRRPGRTEMGCRC